MNINTLHSQLAPFLNKWSDFYFNLNALNSNIVTDNQISLAVESFKEKIFSISDLHSPEPSEHPHKL